jgi:hypothetical protein
LAQRLDFWSFAVVRFVVVLLCVLGAPPAAAFAGGWRATHASTAVMASAPSDPAAAAAAATAAATAGDVEGLPEHAASARSRYLDGDFAGALALADRVDRAFRAGPAFQASTTAWTAWLDARVTGAMALRRLGRDADSDAALQDVAVTRPGYAPDKSFVPPKVVARFDELRAAVLAAPTHPLTIAVEGRGAVVVDGLVKDAGTLDALAGTHFVGLDGAVPARGEVVVVNGPVRVTLPGLTGGAMTNSGGVGDAGGTTTAEDGPPWLWIGVGVGAAVVLGGAIATIAVVANLEDPAPNPGGTTVKIDTSLLGER